MIIAGAGGAAHLPGMTAAMTPLPVFGVPVESKALSGQDSACSSIVQMPAGIPVGTLAIGEAGAVNAALLAAAVLALSDAALAERLDALARRADRQRSPSEPSDDGMSGAARRSDDRHPRRRPARPHAGDGRGAARLPHRHPGAAGRIARRRRSPTGRSSPPMTTRPRSPNWPRVCDVVTYEFENVPVAAAERLARQVPVYPPPRALDVAQDRLAEKRFLNEAGISTTARFRAVDNDGDLAAALQAFGGPAC